MTIVDPKTYDPAPCRYCDAFSATICDRCSAPMCYGCQGENGCCIECDEPS